MDAAARAQASDQLHQGVLNAIEDRNFVAAVEILEGLARVDPLRAVELYDQIQEGLVIARFLNGGSGGG